MLRRLSLRFVYKRRADPPNIYLSQTPFAVNENEAAYPAHTRGNLSQEAPRTPSKGRATPQHKWVSYPRLWKEDRKAAPSGTKRVERDSSAEET